MTDNIYKYAAQNQLRFPSIIGDLLAEDLFELPLTSERKANLDDVAKTINRELKDISEESFVATTSNPRKKELEIALEIVKDVIATKQAENAAALAKTHKAEERKKILDALGAKKDQALTAASIEELEAKLAALDA